MRIFSLLETQYQQFVDQARTYLSKTLSNYQANYGNATIFGQLINVLCAVGQNLMLYLEDALTEQNKYTAQRKKSIYGLAAISGYQPSTGKASGVQLKLSFTPTNATDLAVVLNNHEPLTCTQNGLTYNLILPQEAIVLSAAKDPSARYLYAVQGRFESQTFMSQGGKFYTQNFKYSGNLDIDYIEVRINNELWERTESVYDMEPDKKQYTTRIGYINGIDLVFGNDVHGRALKEGDVIKVTYLLHDGESGNLDVNTETVFVFDNPLSDISGETLDGNNSFYVTFATNDACISGSNSESIDQVRMNIGLNSRALVLASPQNYKLFLDRFSFCGYNRTWSERGSLIVNSLILRNYAQQLADGKDYFNLTEKDFFLTEDQKSSIKKCIEASGQQLAGVSYNIFDPELCKYAMYVYVTLKSTSHDREWITNQIRKIVGEFFSDVASDTFIPKSDIIHELKTQIDALDGVNIYFLSEQNETALQTRKYLHKTFTLDPVTGSYTKHTEWVHLYAGENPQIGLDAHGNILLQSDEQFPVLMGGWDFLNSEGQEVKVVDPLIIVFE